MTIKSRLFASVIGILAFTATPADATCRTQPNLRVDGVDRTPHRKCSYQEMSSKEARSGTSSLPSAVNSQAASPSSAEASGLSAWLSSISAALTSNVPTVAPQNEAARDPRSAEPAREPSRLRAAQRDRSHNRRANVEQVPAKHVDPDNSRARRADSGSRRQDVNALVEEFKEFQEFLRWKERQNVAW